MHRIEELTEAVKELTLVLRQETPAEPKPQKEDREIKPKATATRKKRRQETPVEEPEPQKEEATHIEVTQWVTDLAGKTGKTDEIVAVVKDFGVSRISDIPLENLLKFKAAVLEVTK